MSLRKKQSIFAINFAKLIVFAYEQGYEATYGEGLRTKNQQTLYFKGYTLVEEGSSLKLAKTKPLSKTMSSFHLKKLAHDINLFKDGILLNDKESFKIISEYWKSLDPDNTCGYFWGWDLGHFQMG